MKLPHDVIPGDILTHQEREFVNAYLVTYDAEAAFRRAGLPGVPFLGAQGLMRSDRVREAIEMAFGRIYNNVLVTAENVTAEIRDIAFADARELTGVHSAACRHCWGMDYGYQPTPAEARASAMRTKRKYDPDRIANGVGFFDGKRQPNPECPECFGNGSAVPYAKDTRLLSPAAAALFAGVKVTPHGIEVKTHPKMAALELLGRVVKLWEGKSADIPAEQFWKAVREAAKQGATDAKIINAQESP